MSTDDIGDRTQRPTERRRREARSRGDVARSADLVSALVLLSAAGGSWWLGPALGTELTAIMRSALSSSPSPVLTETVVAAQLSSIALRLAWLLLPILLLVAAAGAFSNLLQTGFLWVPTAITPNFSRLSPASRLEQCWAPHSWARLAWSLVKLATLLAVLMSYVRGHLTSAGPLVDGSPQVIYGLTMHWVLELATQLSLALVILAIFEYAYQYWRQECRLMMTIEEVRREQREDEGNAQQKGRRQQFATSLRAEPVREL